MKYYPFDSRIHNVGNIGLLGKMHAELAPMITKNIDNKAYYGIDIRKVIYNSIPLEYNVLDLCCGVGLSTRKISKFNYKKIGHTIGIDTSPQMINKAKKLNKKSEIRTQFKIGNAENFEYFENYFDVVTCMFAFHEMPEYAHNIIINNSLKLAKKEIIILDIAPNYKSNFIMRSGEPYLLNYQKTINKTMNKYNFTEYILVPNHAHLWSKTF